MTIAASIIFILLATYWFGFKEGFFSGLIHLACVIVAGAVAFAFWEPLAVAMLGSSSTREWAWGVSLLAIFCFALFLLRLAGNLLIPDKLNFPHLVDILGGGATVVAFARNPDKLAVAKDYGVDHAIAIEGKSAADVGRELGVATGRGEFDAVIDCAGAPEMMQLGFELLSTSGHYVDVGLVGDRIDIPLFPRVSREQTFHGSFWGNNTDLSEVMVLAARERIRHTIETIAFDQLNEYLDLLRAGEIVGRAVMKF